MTAHGSLTARGRGRGVTGGLLAVALAAGAALTGCSTGSAGPQPTHTPAPAGEVANDGAAAAGEPIGAADSVCPLPVTFDLARSWSPEAVDPEEFGEDFASLVLRGPVALVCEIDAKPAGSIGYLRVWTGEPDQGAARELLEAFLAEEGEVTAAEYRDTEAGELPATEVVYRKGSALDDGTRTQRALAVATPGGAVIIHLGSLDDEEYEEMLPAYELARATLRAT